LEDESTKLRKRWSALKEKELLDLNKQLKKAKLPEIDPKKPLAQEPGGASDGDDEP
jgi:hypothetical protein